MNFTVIVAISHVPIKKRSFATFFYRHMGLVRFAATQPAIGAEICSQPCFSLCTVICVPLSSLPTIAKSTPASSRTLIGGLGSEIKRLV